MARGLFRASRRVCILMLVVLTGCPGLERSSVFQPLQYPEGNWHPENLAYEDAWFQSADGVLLHGWFCEAENPRAILLYAHGNAGNITSRAPLVQILRDQLNVSVLIFDYRGYGRSGGAPSEAGVLADARAARRWLTQRTGVNEQDIVLLGRSLGGAVMVDLAARDGARGLILENTFTSLPDVVAHHVPLLPASWLMTTRFDSLSKIRQYHGALLQTHGDQDVLVPFELGQMLFKAANEPKRFIPGRGLGHNDPPTPEYVKALKEFLASLP